MKSKYTFSIILSAFLITACGGGDANENQTSLKPVTVSVETVKGNYPGESFSVSGKVAAKQQANLGTRIMGFVNDIPVKTGDHVKAGQVLLRLDQADMQAKLAQVNAGISEAEAAFTNAEKDYNRFQSLFADQSATQKELDDMTTRYRMAQARLESARQMQREVSAQFAYTQIKAPFSGLVVNTFVKSGDLVNPGQPLLAIEDPDEFEIKAQIPENYINQVKVGDSATIWIKTLNAKISGQISELSTSARNTGGQYEVTLALTDKNQDLRSGMFASVEFSGIESLVESENIVLIPSEILVERGELKGIYTVSQSNTAVLRWLRIGREYGDRVEVLAGLEAGESYVVSAAGKLYNGAPLSIQ